MNKSEFNPNWASVEKRPVWGTVTTRELSRILGVPLQSIHNWVIRGHFIEPEPRRRGKGNKNRFSIAKIRSWLEDRSAEEITWEWINEHMHEDFPTIEAAQADAGQYWRAFGIELVKI